MTKTETLKEFLARGGQITRIEPQEAQEAEHVIKMTNTPAHIMSLDWGEHYFAERQKRETMTPEEKNSKGKKKLSTSALQYLKKD